MSRRTFQDWFVACQRRAGRGQTQCHVASPHRRPLRFEPLEDRRLLALVTVTTLGDSIDFNDGVTSLREAIFATNLVGGADTIDFAPSLTAGGPATILLTHGELAIADSLTINGPGANLLTIDASGNDLAPNSLGGGSRVFNINDGITGSTMNVEIRDLTLTGGDISELGGAIHSRELLLAERLNIVDNWAAIGGAIAISVENGASTIADCSISANVASSQGGAIFVQGTPTGTVIIRDSTITQNQANRGGALYANPASTGSSLIISGTTIADNSAIQQGGAIYLTSNSAPKTTIRSSTISGNTAGQQGGGLFVMGGRDLAIIDSTLANNQSLSISATQGRGGGIYAANSDVAITGSTISGNSALFGGGVYSKNGELAIIGTTIESNRATDGNGGGVFTLNDRLSIIGSTISGNVASGASGISGRGGGLFYSVGSTVPPTFVDDQFIGNSAANYGGGVYWRSAPQYQGASVTFNNVTIASNKANRGGGLAITAGTVGATGGTLSMIGGSIRDNTAIMNGGGLYSRATAINFNGTTISGNHAGSYGGGIAAPNSGRGSTQLSFFDATISDNLAGVDGLGGDGIGDGGGIWMASSSTNLSLVQSQVSSNSARRGGGIFRGTNIGSGALLAVDSTITGNMAEDRGGGVYDQGGSLSLTTTAITGNTAAGMNIGHGGGIFARAADVSLVNSSLTGNSSLNARGGGLYLAQSGDLTILGSTIAGNFAKMDGGGVAAVTSQVNFNLIQSSTISGNSSQRTGGLYLRGVTTIRNSTITKNSGGSGGTGGLFAGDGSQQLELDHALIAGNTASEGGSPDLRSFLGPALFTVRFSLIGDNTGTSLAEAPVGSPDANGNLIGKPISKGGQGVIDPLLAPLANNGGPTLTHALLPGSPALDGGALVTGPPQGYDQRGNPFSRMVDGTGDGIIHIDIGAYESQGVPHFSPGDYNRDGFVNACDYTSWRNTLGSQVTPFDGADGNGNGLVDGDDHAIWMSHFGAGLEFTFGGGGSAGVAAFESTAPRQSAASFVSASQPPALRAVGIHAVTRYAKTATIAGAVRDDALAAWLAARPHDTFTGELDDDSSTGSSKSDDGDAIDEAIDAAFAAIGV